MWRVMVREVSIKTRLVQRLPLNLEVAGSIPAGGFFLLSLENMFYLRENRFCHETRGRDSFSLGSSTSDRRIASR
jgi:hypothetical protein